MGDLGIGLLVLGWVNDLNTPVSETLSGYSAGLHVDRPGSRGVQNPGSRSCTPLSRRNREEAKRKEAAALHEARLGLGLGLG